MCRIWWDLQVEAYRIQTPYNEQFIEALKKLIPANSDRTYDPDTKIWLISERFFPPVETLAKAVWPAAGEVVITTRAQAESQQQQQQQQFASTTHKQPINGACEQFLRLLPYDAALSAYRKAATLLHPDKGGEMEKMALLNSLWNRIKEEVYKQ